MRLRIIFVSVACLLCFVCCKSDDDTNLSIAEPNFITSDIDLFWKTYDSSPSPSSVDFQNLYINQGTKGLRDYAAQKNLASSLASTLSIDPYLKYYNAVRTNTYELSEAIDSSKEAFLKLEEVYPETNFFNVYFLIGSMTAGGRVSDNGLLIAVEMFSKNEETPLQELSGWHQSVIRNKEYLPSIVVHEFIHMQQKFRSQNQSFSTTLEQSIFEGMADFISSYLLEGKPFMNEHLHLYGDPIEKELWEEFNIEKNVSHKNTQWLYTGQSTDNGHPSDMGYYIGFKILESYSATFGNMEDAIATMLTKRNYNEIFEQSGYANKFD